MSLVQLLASKSYREGDFVLSSGARSTFYLDAKQVTYDAEGARLVGEAVLELARARGITAVGGLTMGADAIVASTVYASGVHGYPMIGFIVRKESKQHGLQKFIEGVNPEGHTAVIVDDVITSAGSAIKAVERAEAAGATVKLVVGVVDRQEGGAEALAARGIEFVALATLTEIRAAVTAGR
jgi:orotate phosphoribosyltransferase